VLVLTRRVGEKVVVGDDVTITVLEVRPGGDVRLGIDAPSSVRIHRAEVLDAISAANAEAAAAGEDTAALFRAAVTGTGTPSDDDRGAGSGS